MAHDYLSTACLHDHHGECRHQCKFCEAPCGCPCHMEAHIVRIDIEEGP